MTNDGKFVTIEDFRENATWDDYVELFEFYLKYLKGTEKFPTKEEPRPECFFQFSAAEAMQELDECELEYGCTFGNIAAIVERVLSRESATKEKVHFIIGKGKYEFIKQSVMMTEDHWNRLQRIYDQYSPINKYFVLNGLLEEIISKYEV